MCISLEKSYLQSLARASILRGRTPPPKQGCQSWEDIPQLYWRGKHTPYNLPPQKIEILKCFKKSIFPVSNSLGKHPMNSSSASVDSFFKQKYNCKSETFKHFMKNGFKIKIKITVNFLRIY